ncbi:MAG: regulatory iron-sulfur-containing complex subunit RicT [candidate division WOR-3 bacterium]
MSDERLTVDERSSGQGCLVRVHPFRVELCSVPTGLTLLPGDTVVISDEEGLDMGRVVRTCSGEDSLCTVVRKATEDDLRLRAEQDNRRSRLLELFEELRAEFGLEMEVVGVHCRLDGKKVCFYFVSEERLDFRGLHKAVSSALNVRVAIKQIGVRDHARLLGGLGPCGRELCCSRSLAEMKPIALRMARQQNLFVEPSKISGVCGKLLCCLSYEDETYRELFMDMPRVGVRVVTERGEGVVTAIDVLTRRVRVRYGDDVEMAVALEDLGRGSDSSLSSHQSSNGDDAG